MNRIAYLVVAHADPVHLERLARKLAPHADLFVHIDAKSDRSKFAAVEALPNVSFVERRYSVTWGGVSQVHAILSAMRMAMATGKDYAKVALISGTCYPLASVEDIHAWFEKEPDREIIRWIDMRQSPILMKVIRRRWFKDPLVVFRHPKLRLLEKTFRFGLRKLCLPNPHPWPKDLVPCFGSSWWALSGKCCNWILDTIDAQPWRLELVKDCFGPDEHFFHTMVANSPFAAKADGRVEFQYISTWYVANFHMIDPYLVKWFTLDDWDEIAASGMPFLRKVRTDLSASLLDRIDAEPQPIRHPVR